MKSSNKRIFKYRCPYCETPYTREDLVKHIDDKHDDMIPEGYTALRLVFDYVNKKATGYNGMCRMCTKETGWDESKGRYNIFCSKQCADKYKKQFEDRMNGKYGYDRISKTSEGQKKMLANRKISGKYKFQDGKEFSYCGTYELEVLKFMDLVLNIKSEDLLVPGPDIEYMYEGQKHLYIPDIYYIPYNLIIEVKDGGDNPNKRDMPEYRTKQELKEKQIIDNTDYNYLRLTNKDCSQLMSIFAELKFSTMTDNSRVVRVNEAMYALTSGYMPGMKDAGNVLIVNYMQNNVFAGDNDDKRRFAIANNPKLDKVLYRDEDGKLNKADGEEFLRDKEYEVFSTNISRKTASNKLYKYFGKSISENFIYETLFEKKMYTEDQFMFDESVNKIVPFKVYMETIKELTENYIKKPNNDTMDAFYYGLKRMVDDKTGLYLESETDIPEDKQSVLRNLLVEVK